MFNVNVRIINANLKFHINVPTQEAKFYKNLYINQISKTNVKKFSNQHFDTALILRILRVKNSVLFEFLSFYMKHIFMLSILFKSHPIRHSGWGRAFKESKRALKYLMHSESTRAIGHLERT